MPHAPLPHPHPRPPCRSKSLVDELRPELPERSKKAQVPYCVCLAWSADGSTLYSGEAAFLVPVRRFYMFGAVHLSPPHCALVGFCFAVPCSGIQANPPCSSPQLCSTSIPQPAGYTDGAIRVWQVGRAI